MAHNVPAVYDVLPARISKRKSVQYILTPLLRLQGWQNVATQNTTKGESPTGVLRSPSRRKAAKRKQTC
jgi:hypothetical protein